MADTKITALAAITTVDPAADVLPIVDISDTSMAASGTTKKITTNQILGAGGTATLASATITGDLTAARWLISGGSLPGVGNANPFAYRIGGGGLGIGAATETGTTAPIVFYCGAGGVEQYRIAPLGVNTWSDGAGGTRMTLNSTGLGLGVSPITALSFPIGTTKIVAQSAVTAHLAGNAGTLKFGVSDGGGDYSGLHVVNSHNGTYSSQDLLFFTGEGGVTLCTERMRVTKSGNLVVGTTSQNGSWNTKLTLSNDSGTTNWAVGPYLGGVTNFLISAGASAGVYLNGTAATSWTSASDERLKDIIEPISNAVSKVASLRAVIGKFKFDENNTRKPFLIAQDIQAVLPEAVDASNPDKLGVAYTDVIPLLVAAIKELTARVQTLEAK